MWARLSRDRQAVRGAWMRVRAAVVLGSVFFAVPALASGTKRVVYEATDEDFANPERGFFIQRSYDPARSRTRPTLSLEELRRARLNHISLVRLLYSLREFREAPIAEELLERLHEDFGQARQAGVKIILRFSYSSAIGQPDASLERILSHIEQLRPVLRRNADVLAFMEAGFAGAWGEWHSSTHGLFDTGPGMRWPQVNDRTRAILDKLLEALPPDRMVALRCPRFKWAFFGEAPLSLQEAFAGTARARTGAHNDCFLASADDMGTYTDRMAEEKAFYHQDNLFVPQGGETCSAGPRALPYITCENALKELAYLRYSTLNLDYHRQVLAVWEQGGCMPQIRRRLGYRFRLVESQIPDSAQPGSAFRISFTVTNEGWANLYNPRPVEVVLRNSETRKLHVFRLEEDPRLWMPGETKVVDAEIKLPADAPQGASYEVLVQLPDASPGLRQRPEYAVRFANPDVWDAATGMNSLRERVQAAASVGR